MKSIMLRGEKIHSGNLVLVNAQYPFRESKASNIAPVDYDCPNVFMNRDAANILLLIFERISSGKSIVPISGYRTLEEQRVIYENSLHDKGEEFTRRYVALPNHSEHHTGLAIDLALGKESVDFICPEFPYEGICDDFRSIAPDYGFIERYSKDKEEITGISHEPWHFRYVGFPHSKIIVESGMSLEEYIDFLKDYRVDDKLIFNQENKGFIEIYYTPTYDGETTLTIKEKSVHQISGNNVDGFITTIWRNVNE